jgi:hypothetical protein
MPALALENTEKSSFIIQNSDALLKCRTLQIKLDDDMVNKDRVDMSGNIYVYEDESVIQEYIQTEIHRQKTLLLERYSITSGDLKLFADPESKSIHLFYRGTQLTTASGVECSFRCRGKLLNTFYAAKFIPVKKDNALFIELYWKEASLAHGWKLFFKDNQLRWEISHDKSSSDALENFKIGLNVSSEYKHFFCGAQEAAFPEKFTIWSDMPLDAPGSRFFGVRKSDNRPALALENTEKSAFIIQNSDSLLKCRTLQVKLDDETVNKDKFNILQKISVYDDEAFMLDYIQTEIRKQKASLLEKYAITSGDLKLFADPGSKSIHLFYKGIELTKWWGVFTGLLWDSTNYLVSFDSEWKVEKFSECLIEISVNYKEKENAGEIFTLGLADDSLSLKIEIENREPSFMSGYFLRFDIDENYTEWITPYEKGSISGEYIGDIIPASMRENKINEILLKAKRKDVPDIKMSSSFNAARGILSLHKRRGEGVGKVCLQYEVSFFKDEEMLLAGRHTLFEGKISMGEQITEVIKRPGSFSELKKAGLNFIFDRGRAKLIYEGREITKGLGVYSSVRVKGVWHDSYQAIWRTELEAKDKIVLYGKWLSLPFYQKWSVEIKDNSILWTIDSENPERMNIEIEQANIMAVEGYDKWELSNGLKGQFEGFYTEDYDIIPFRYCYISLKEPAIEMRGEALPSLTFKSPRSDNFKVLIENSDNFYKARMLQYQKVNKESPPCRYGFFEGEIFLDIAENEDKIGEHHG